MKKNAKYIKFFLSLVLAAGIGGVIFIPRQTMNAVSADQAEKVYTEVHGERDLPYLVNNIHKLERPYNYIIGKTKYLWIEILGYLLTLGVFFGVMGHALLRVFFNYKNQKAQPFQYVHKGEDFIYDGIIRTGHWLNALFIITLIVTGFTMHYSGPSHVLGYLHNMTGISLTVLYIFFLIHAVVRLDYKQYFPGIKEILSGQLVKDLIKNGMFYLHGIFVGTKNPFHSSHEHRLMPIQKVSYMMAMYVQVPLVVITGVVLVDPANLPFVVSLIGMENMNFVFIVHLLAAFTVFMFLIIHLYMITAGDKIAQHLMTMVTGYHKTYDKKEISK